jgi:CheY-like chemotaxis protein
MQLPVTPLVIAATAATTISDREKSLQHMDDFISKPISLQNLKGTLERVWLKSGRAPLSFAQDEQPGAPSNSQGGSPTPVIRRPASARRLEVQLAAEAAAIKDQTRIVYSLLFIIGLLCSALLAVIAKPVLA